MVDAEALLSCVQATQGSVSRQDMASFGARRALSDRQAGTVPALFPVLQWQKLVQLCPAMSTATTGFGLSAVRQGQAMRLPTGGLGSRLGLLTAST